MLTRKGSDETSIVQRRHFIKYALYSKRLYKLVYVLGHIPLPYMVYCRYQMAITYVNMLRQHTCSSTTVNTMKFQLNEFVNVKLLRIL